MKDKIHILKEIIATHGIPVSTKIGHSNPNEFLNSFFSKVGRIRTVLNQIQYYYQQIVKLHNEILSSPDQNNDDKNELEVMMEFVKRDTGLVRFELKEMEKEVTSSEIDLHNPSIELRIKKTQHAILSYICTDLIVNYNLAQVEYRNRCKERILRQLAMANRKIEDDQLEDMLEQDNVAIFTHEIVTETEQAKKSLEEVEARHADIIKLERSIKDLHEMFLDMAILIEAQGEMIDRIEYNVANAQEYVEKAVVDIKKAVEYNGKNRKRKIICISVVVVIIIILLGVTIGVYGK